MDPFKIKTNSGENDGRRKVSARFRHTLDWEEAMIDGSNAETDSEATLEEVPEQKRLVWMYVFIFVLISILVFRAGDLQIAQGDELARAAEINRVRKFPISAPRGVIFDRNQNQLVENIPNFQVVLIPADFDNLSEEEQSLSVEALERLTDKKQDEIRQVVDSSDPRSYEPVILLESLEREQALILESKREEIIGFQVVSNSRRNYFDENFSHVLGYTGVPNEEEVTEATQKDPDAYLGLDVIGKTGIEKVYDTYLRGYPGSKEIEVDATGREENLVAIKDPVPGQNLELTIDKGLQDKAAENLEHILREANLQKGSFVATNPNTGEILALVNSPKFDNNKFAAGISVDDYKSLIEDPAQPLFNRSIGGTYASGSVIKPVVGAAALQEGVITENTTVIDTGSIEIENKYDPSIKYYFYGWNRNGLGPVNIYTAIALSSNPYFYQVGGGYQGFEGLGPELISRYYDIFGFGKKTGIDLPGEAKGLVPTREWKDETKGERWNLGDTYNIAIGQGDFLATPLQINNAIAAISNGGTLYQPFLAKSLVDESDGSEKNFSPTVIRENLVDSYNLSVIRQAMRASVTHEKGTARSLRDLPVAVAAKTGTAQFQGNNLEHSWFVAFAPFEDPQVALTVLVEEGGSGAEAAAIVARDTLNWYFGGRPESVNEDPIIDDENVE